MRLEHMRNAHTLAAQWLSPQDSKVARNNTPKRESAGLRNRTRQERIIMAKHRKCESYKINKFLHLGSKGYGCKVLRSNSIKKWVDNDNKIIWLQS